MTDPTVRPTRLHVVADHRPGHLRVADEPWLDAWLGILGPTSTLLAQRFARDLTDSDAVYDVAMLAGWLGVAPSVLWRSVREHSAQK